MKECKKYERLIKQFIANEIGDEDKKLLLEHIQQCKACKSLYEMHNQLETHTIDFPEASAEDYLKVRQSVIRSIRNKKAASDIKWYQYFSDRFLSIFSRPAVTISFSVILFLIGFFLYPIILPSRGQSNFDLARQLKYTAQQNTDLQQVENSPYIFSDVRFKNVNGDQVEIGFNVSTHMELVRHKDDPLVKEVLAQAVMNPASLGNRLQAISYSEEIMDSKVKEALIFTMLNDNNLAVRIKAMTSLAKYPSDSKIQDAFLKILKNDEQVQLRLLAIDYLTSNLSNEKNLEEIIRDLNQAKDAGIKYKLSQLIKN
jgi:hypothetical protein